MRTLILSPIETNDVSCFVLFAKGARSTGAPVVSLHSRVSGRHTVTLWGRQLPGFAGDKKKTKAGLLGTLVFVIQVPISRPAQPLPAA